MSIIKRVYVKKLDCFSEEGELLTEDLKNNLLIKNINSISIYNRYDIQGVNEDELKIISRSILSKVNTDECFYEDIDVDKDKNILVIEYQKGQFDKRANACAECIRALLNKNVIVSCAKVYKFDAELSNNEFESIKKYMINPIDSVEGDFTKPKNLEIKHVKITDVKIIDGFIDYNKEDLLKLREDYSFSMSNEDLLYIQEYFIKEKRCPTITELKVLDTYWSDHCRHTTFMSEITDIEIIDDYIQDVYNKYIKDRESIGNNKPITLMDIATLYTKVMRNNNELKDLDISDEINACSINIKVKKDDDSLEDWLLMFKNETHNHPTEIEPYGGASTCLGGAIRDPLSGRAYVYQAMRVTGSANPLTPVKETLKNKLPQIVITKEAAKGYSSYGNQIGLCTGEVKEYYDEGFLAKRMEVGAVIGAVKKEFIRREKPVKGDLVLLVGGRTGRDGIGGATGSSKEHDDTSINECFSEVQKGNPIEERKLQRLFRNKDVTKLIKKCNDFGAGGVSVAVGELSDGLLINLDNIKTKYNGLDATELALSESQERMAIVIESKDLEKFLSYVNEENIEASVIAEVTDDNKLVMMHKGKVILDIKREFLDSNGAKSYAQVKVKKNELSKFDKKVDVLDIKNTWLSNTKELNNASQKYLIEQFDSTIGANTVLLPLGGKYQYTPSDGMVSKIPVLNGDTSTCSIMTHGYDPSIANISPFHGGMYSVVNSLSKIVALGGNYKKVRLSFQEYFEKLGNDKSKWGKPFSALLGAYLVKSEIDIPAIGGKDSMSGTFKELNVPPTLISFAVVTEDVSNIISQEIKQTDTSILLIEAKRDSNFIFDFTDLKNKYDKLYNLAKQNVIISAKAVTNGGIADTITKMALGNNIGLKFNYSIKMEELFKNKCGSIIIEIKNNDIKKLDEINLEYNCLFNTIKDNYIEIDKKKISLDEIKDVNSNVLNKVFKSVEDSVVNTELYNYKSDKKLSANISIAKPSVIIPIFPGTNCEYDTTRAFERAGAKVKTYIMKNITISDIEESIKELARLIDKSNILSLVGGFSASDEPDGSGKFISTILNNERIKNSITDLINNRDGLILGICNGFQALIKVGLLPYGKIVDINKNSPTLTNNTVLRHVAKMNNTRIASNKSPWLSDFEVGDIHNIAFSHGEGRFITNDEVIKNLIDNGQVATQYVDLDGKGSNDGAYNINGSDYLIEGITSVDGRIFGKMGHSERFTNNTLINAYGNKKQDIFHSGVKYYK